MARDVASKVSPGLADSERQLRTALQVVRVEAFARVLVTFFGKVVKLYLLSAYNIFSYFCTVTNNQNYVLIFWLRDNMPFGKRFFIVGLIFMKLHIHM